MRQSNLYVSRVEERVFFPYNQHRFLLPPTYNPESQHQFVVFTTVVGRQEGEGRGIEAIEGVAKLGALVRITITSSIKDKGKEDMNVYVGIAFARVRIISLKKQANVQRATVDVLPQDQPKHLLSLHNGRQIRQVLKDQIKLYYHCVQGKLEAERNSEKLDGQTSILKMFYQTLNQMKLTLTEKMEFLQTESLQENIERLIKLIRAKTQSSKDIMALESNVRAVMDVKQNNALPQGKRTAAEEMAGRMRERGVPEHVREQIERELKEMGQDEDRQVAQKYIDTLIDIPWTQYTPEVKDILAAERMMEQDHLGLKAVKERILQHIAVRFRNGNFKGNVICLHGPPGVGKTSIVKSIAKALGRKYAKIALGGVGDEAQMRGHRRTYTGALPGRIIRALIESGSSNPLILLDEIDKIGDAKSGGLEHALLQVLDPSQNSSFVDHYVALPVDLSKVMFVCTANSLQLSKPLLDRFQIIEVAGYSRQEKAEIARVHLVPQQVRENGVQGLAEFDGSAIEALVTRSREPGVRSLQRNIAKVCRKVARANRREVITKERIEDILGEKRKSELWSGVGVVHGLAGRVLTIQAVRFPSARQQVVVTGQLGEAMRESVDVALSCLRGNFEELPPFVTAPKLLEEASIHLHFPQGATKKDGASAGLPILACLLSLLLKTPPRNGLAMTGEITLSGRVLAVGGIREKCMAAIHEGIQHIIIPEGNLRDISSLDPQLRKQLVFHGIRDVKEVLPLVFPIVQQKRAKL